MSQQDANRNRKARKARTRYGPTIPRALFKQPATQQHHLRHIGLVAIYSLLMLLLVPIVISLFPYHLPPSQAHPPTLIYSGDGQVLARLADNYRIPVRLEHIPRYTIRAILAAEDIRFYRHHGLDLRGIARAAWMNLRSRHIEQGGSTITQQLVRVELLHGERSWTRKLLEAVLAVRVERAEQKHVILERYLNMVYFSGGAYGIGAAAREYFRKDVRRLTVAESALLAGLLRGPGAGDPRYHFVEARRRQLRVLATMRRQGWLNAAQYQIAVREHLHIHPRERFPWRAPYVVDAVRQVLTTRYGRDTVYQGGMTVYTTLHADMQTAAEHALARAVRAGRGRRVGNGALVAIDPHTGEIRALVGGTQFADSQFNRATQAHRQPGSAFKAFVYQAALDRGRLLSDQVMDAPVDIDGWTPHNYGATYHGQVSLETALAYSLNSVAVRLTTEMSPYAVMRAAADAGIESPLRPTASIALGASEVTPMEMAHAYATYANGGRVVSTSLIREVRLGGRLIFRAKPTIAQQRVSPITAFLLTRGLQSVIAFGTGRRANIGRPAAGKTGTSSNYCDAWFIGYTPDLCAAVWLGNDTRRPMAGVTGGSLPTQAWAEFMRAALLGQPPHEFTMPTGVRQVTICVETGDLALPPCPVQRKVYLPLDRIPPLCTRHTEVTRNVCIMSNLLPNPTCPDVEARTFPYNAAPHERCPIDHRQQPGITAAPPPPAENTDPFVPPAPDALEARPPAIDTTPPQISPHEQPTHVPEIQHVKQPIDEPKAEPAPVVIPNDDISAPETPDDTPSEIETPEKYPTVTEQLLPRLRFWFLHWLNGW